MPLKLYYFIQICYTIFQLPDQMDKILHVTAALLPHFAPEASQGGKRHACIKQVLQPFTVAQKQLPCHGAFAHQAALLFK